MLVITVLVSIIFGAAGWWITNFFVRPVLKIEELRQKVHEELIFYGNLGKTAEPQEIIEARNALRRVAAGLISSDVTAYEWVHWWLKWRRLDIKTAGPLLVAESNRQGANYSPEFVIINRANLDKSLRFPQTYSDNMATEARNRLEIPSH